ncbi:MAG: DNA gyrase subunit A [Clostridiales bacterium]|nr:DNA gyrase subunit A [Clostridiales bacterium]
MSNEPSLFDGKVMTVRLEEVMKKSYINYSMSVIAGRALPDVRDGLKPVHRRILYSMHESGISNDKPYRKSARVVGDVMGRYHPHGDSSVYDALVRLAQDFSTRYMLADGQGNFGSVDGDDPAAQRYTEIRLSRIAQEMLREIEKETVDFVPNYDNDLEEPLVLPSRIPNLLVNGSSGIAVGMATNIPPHNLAEVIDGLVAMIDNPQITVGELMEYIKGPDYPTGGNIIGTYGIRQAYETGRGSIVTRGTTEIEGIENGKTRITITEIPYMVNKARLIEKIAELVRDKKVDGITSLLDASDRNGMRILIEVRRDVNPQVVLNNLYKHTQLQESFGVINLALVGGEPRILSLKEMLMYYLKHQEEVIVRRTQYDLRRAEDRLHIVEGLKIAIDFIDEVIRLIRASKDEKSAQEALMNRFGLSDRQAKAIVDMRLGRLSGLERERLETEYDQLVERIAYLRSILADEYLVMKIIKDEMKEIRQRFGDARRTSILPDADDLSMEDLIPDEEVCITITHGGYIKRQPITSFRNQKRGGRGVSSMTTKEADFVEHLFTTTNHNYLLVFTNKGKVYRNKVYDVPEAGRQAKGTAIVNLLYISGEDKITAVIPVKSFDENKFLLTVTRKGIVKKTLLTEYNTARKDGIIALNMDEDDELIGVMLTEGEDELIMATYHGMVIRFSEQDVRPMGRVSRGVRGIRLGSGDYVVSVDNITEGEELLFITEKGFGKSTRLTEFRAQSRDGKGLIGIRCTAKNGNVAGVAAISSGDEVMIVTKEGIMIRCFTDDISSIGRATQGVKVMHLGENDQVQTAAKVVVKDEEENGFGKEEEGNQHEEENDS